MDNFTAQELEKKYHGTFCEVSIKGLAPKPVYIDSIRPNDNGVWMLRHAPINSDLRIDLTQVPLRSVEFLPTPHKKLVLIGKIPSVFYKNPKRQWRRGLCDGNSEFVFALKDLLVGGDYSFDGHNPKGAKFSHGALTPFPAIIRGGIDTERAYAVFQKNKVLSISDGVQMLQKDEDLFGVPLCDEFLLAHTPYKNKDFDFMLLYFSSPIALYSSVRNCINIINPHYYQEVMDFNNRRQCGVRIEE